MIIESIVTSDEALRLFKDGQVVSVRQLKDKFNRDRYTDYLVINKSKGYWHNDKDGVDYMERLLTFKKVLAIQLVDNKCFEVSY